MAYSKFCMASYPQYFEERAANWKFTRWPSPTNKMEHTQAFGERLCWFFHHMWEAFGKRRKSYRGLCSRKSRGQLGLSDTELEYWIQRRAWRIPSWANETAFCSTQIWVQRAIRYRLILFSSWFFQHNFCLISASYFAQNRVLVQQI